MMALFGPKDINLPRLTQFFQVEGVEELHEWLNREKGGNARPPLNKKQDECFARLTTLHSLTKRMMKDLHNRQKVSSTTLEQFALLRKAIPQETQVRSFAWDSQDIEQDEEGAWISPKDVFLGFVESLPYDHNLGKNIAEDLLAIWRTPQKLLRCEECTSIFVARREQTPVQRFCSHRCADRHSARLRRHELGKSSDRNSRKITLDSPTKGEVYCS